ncbi:MAG: hypothetical protein JST01_14755 [Cyanobacteria bacterium SZAS TMP-1]|nr:hypothetical protein [Cyanobacteria bacterium SZAS TMP-1]
MAHLNGENTIHQQQDRAAEHAASGDSHLAGQTLANPGDARADYRLAQASGRSLEHVGTLPKLDLTGDRSLVDRMASDEDQKMFSDLDAIARRSGGPRLTDSQKAQIEMMSPSEKQMYRFAIDELQKLADNKISPSDFMADNLRKAASLAEENGRAPGSWNIFKPTAQELYVQYVSQTFCDHSLGLAKDVARGLAGSPVNNAGIAIEENYAALIKNRADQGFNPNVADTDKSNSITHHYREVLMVAFNSGILAADKATLYLDKPDVNPGDVRNGYFAAMIGSGLYHQKLTPTEAANLTIWAYTQHGGTQPPWGTTNEKNNYLQPSDYYLNPWLRAYRGRTN